MVLTEGNLLLSYFSNLPLGVTNEGPRVIKPISGAVAGDSSLQYRGVARYLLPLLFILVSLPFSLYRCVLYQKHQNIVTFVLLVAAIIGSTENTKLCDFTSDDNNEFICTPIAPPATSAPYEIKHAYK